MYESILKHFNLSKKQSRKVKKTKIRREKHEKNNEKTHGRKKTNENKSVLFS
jgi:hypothetical protein